MNKNSLSILIIEDNAQLAANIYDYLEACGHSLDAAPDGVSGLNLAATREYDAIVLDWNLPRMDGLILPPRHHRGLEVSRQRVVRAGSVAKLRMDGFDIDDLGKRELAVNGLDYRQLEDRDDSLDAGSAANGAALRVSSKSSC